MNETPNSVRYVILIGEVLIFSDDFFDLVIGVKQTFRAHKVPLMCVSNGDTVNEIVLATPFDRKNLFDFDDYKLKEFELALVPNALNQKETRWQHLTNVEEAKKYKVLFGDAKNKIVEEMADPVAA